MYANRTTRFAGLLIAVLLTAAVNGVMLWKFDAVAHDATLASVQFPAVATLEKVYVVANRRS
jgi:hypothetical protein